MNRSRCNRGDANAEEHSLDELGTVGVTAAWVVLVVTTGVSSVVAVVTPGCCPTGTAAIFVGVGRKSESGSVGSKSVPGMSSRSDMAEWGKDGMIWRREGY